MKYVFPWTTSKTISGHEEFTLLDGAIRCIVQRVREGSEDKFSATVGPYDLGLFDTEHAARDAAEHAASTMINKMLEVVLPAQAKSWLQSPV